MYFMLDFILLACGVYVLNGYVQMKQKGIIKEGLLLPKGCSMARCKDKEGYIAEMAPKVLVYGIMLLILGAIGFLQSLYQTLGTLYLIALAVFLPVTFWFTRQVKKAMVKYFS